jgi:hypothetical protein
MKQSGMRGFVAPVIPDSASSIRANSLNFIAVARGRRFGSNGGHEYSPPYPATSLMYQYATLAPPKLIPNLKVH